MFHIPNELSVIHLLKCGKVVSISLLLTLFVAGCATPSSRLKATAESHGFTASTYTSGGFDHLVYTHKLIPLKSRAKNVLHVYLEGDGSPWKYRVVTMPDPTPRNPLVLNLMAKDGMASAYIGRPCYNGTAKADGCNAELWTSGRYSPKVVRSMSGVIRDLVQQHRFEEVRLIGHSGGGTLAMLIAAKLEMVSRVVTVAGNLDTEAWTTHHGYSRLYTSLNPAVQPALPEHIEQWHLLGGRDAVIPASIVTPFVVKQKNALGVRLEHFSHGCCWEASWGVIANAIGSSRADSIPGKRFKYPDRSIVQPDSQ